MHKKKTQKEKKNKKKEKKEKKTYYSLIGKTLEKVAKDEWFKSL